VGKKEGSAKKEEEKKERKGRKKKVGLQRQSGSAGEGHTKRKGNKGGHEGENREGPP